ncbi:MAG: AraC family transcriptional regulator [Oceanospirillales bacterium]|nr:AraC family transcriptional regulator [Oceanospirillales bacterium]MBR9888556.1 AraC family transcriptional regulator [Oceanospirillales bacterium]
MKVRDIEQQFIRLPGMPQMELRSTWDSQQGYKSHSHSQFSIGLLHSGETCLSCNDDEQKVVAGELVIIEPDRVHACNPVGNGSRGYYMLYIEARWCLQWLSSFYASGVNHFYCEQTLVRDPQAIDTFVTLVEHLQRQDGQAIPITLERLATHLLLPYCSPAEGDRVIDHRCVELKQRLLADLQNPPTLADLAAISDCTPEAVIRMFRRHYGITPKAFVNNARIEQAKLLLREGVPIVDVAGQLGFFDQSQFHRTFVNYTASTPGQYQQSQ